MKELLCKNWMYWRGKSGASAKYKKNDLNFCNYQKKRYCEKYFRFCGFTDEQLTKINNTKIV